MESPVSDFASNDNLTDDLSTPSDIMPAPAAFVVRFGVKVTEPIKDGEHINYTVKTVRHYDTREFSVSRQYEDFEYLHHCLITQNQIGGIIVPPLPPRPLVEAKGAESKSKKQLGSSSKVLMGDDFERDCRALEKYLKLIIGHDLLGRSDILEKFLLEKQAQIRAKAKRGILGKLSAAVEENRIANRRDIDDLYQRERDSAAKQATLIKECSDNFNQMVYSQQRISGAYGHLSTALNLGSSLQLSNEDAVTCNRLFIRFSEGLDDAKHGSDVDAANDENTLGFHLDLYTRYAEAVKDMLHRRTCLMVAYEDANKALGRAKPNKVGAAEEAKITAERAFEEASDIGRKELQNYQHRRLLAFQDALNVYSEAKVKTARDTYALLAKSLVAFKQFEI